MPNQTEQSQVLEGLQPTTTAHQATGPMGRMMDNCIQCSAMVSNFNRCTNHEEGIVLFEIKISGT